MNHLGDLVSALLDGELTAGERAAAEAHLAGCPDCRTEMARTAAMRSLVRGLPPIEPPFGFVEGLVRADRRRRPAAVFAAAAAVAAAVGLAVTPRSDGVAPPVGRFVEAHATATPGGDPVTNLGPPSVLPVSFRP
ncbi:MAG: putative zinc-finger [Actinomycetota bacterium]|jgi:anti-sigma factor RsiW